MILGQFQFRRDSAANWTSANPILLSGELGLETDTAKFKIGNGTSAWNSLPYGGIQGQQGIQGQKGWSPVLSVVSDGERRVLRLVDYVGGEGTKPSIPTDNYIGATGLTTLANAIDIRGATGATGAQGPTGPAANAFTNIAVAGQTTVSAEVANDTLTITNGTGISVTTDAANDSITITNNDRGSAQNIFKNIAVSGQSTIVADTNDDTLTIVGSGSVTVTTDAATDTVTISGAVSAPQNCFAVVTGNTGTASADLPADTLVITGGTGISTTATDTPDGLVINNTGVTSVNGQTGAVTIPVATAVTRTAPTASASTALTTIQSYPVATGEITAGSEYEFYASLRVINTTTATNAVVTLSVGAVNVLVLTQAIGATAAAAPGAAVELYGQITFYSATAAEAYIRASKQAAVAFDAVANTAASVTVAAATATTIDLKFNTSGATSTFIARQATIRRVK